ncbi:plasmid stabilization protein [Scytonema hofmannii PCC 7110]|uniref:Plasmid stabilization protein n=1 Tax=Scytonema hofmannii PCC 7110 TaxID=128403 RepID=A0A139X080_9CYAN|nr:type II toxin-antitoxin system RelE/ParE family toxin [Scytonema hofmannii]KYC38117.1 plasmid stabilization protein [Scytonema hofmannii PCC 7110]
MWKIEFTKRFLKDLADLPEEIQARIEPIIFQELESENPFELGYLEKMKGYADKYKIRVGDYRIGISIEKDTQTLICQRVAHRKDIYRIFP